MNLKGNIIQLKMFYEQIFASLTFFVYHQIYIIVLDSALSEVHVGGLEHGIYDCTNEATNVFISK